MLHKALPGATRNWTERGYMMVVDVLVSPLSGLDETL